MNQALTLFASIAAVLSGTAILSADETTPSNLDDMEKSSVAKAATEKQRQTRFQSSKRGFYVAADVNGKPVTFLIDTGASLSVLTATDAAALGIQSTSSKMVAGIGGTFPAKAATVDLNVDGRMINGLEVAIMDTAPHSLLGLDVIYRLGTPELVLH